MVAALEDGAAPITALAPERDGDAITLRYRLAGVAEPRRVTCRFAAGDDAGALIGVEASALAGVEGGDLSAPRLAMLRIWLGLEDVADDDDAAPGAPRAPPLSPLGYFLQQLLNGLVLGAIYCLIAVGYAQVFSLLEIVNFAFGELFTIGAYLAIVVFVLLAASDLELGAAEAALALLATVALIVPWGWAIERAVYRPLGIARATNAARLIPLVSAIGLSIFLENLVRVSQGNRNKWLAPVIEGRLTVPLGDGSALAIGWVQLAIVGAAAALCGALWWLLARTRFGRQQRACAQDRIAAALLGVDVERVISRTFMLGAGLAGVAGFSGRSVDGLQCRLQGPQRRGAGRHRLDRRRDDRRRPDRSRGVVMVGIFRWRLSRRGDLRGPDRRADRAPVGAARRSRQDQQLSPSANHG